MSTTDYSRSSLTEKLSAILDALPDDGLLSSLKTYHAGRIGYGARVLFRAYVASFVLNTSSLSAALRAISDNPRLVEIVGGAPTKFALSRFVRKLKDNPQILERLMALVADDLKELLPRLGEIIALDSTDIKAWARRTKGTDPDATTGVKQGSDGRKKFWYGYKTHLVCDATYELPLAAYVTPANVSDQKQVGQSLSFLKHPPRYVLADAGYDSMANRQLVEEYGAVPIIKRNPRGHKVPKSTMLWEAVYSCRSSIERIFSRSKEFRRLDRLTLRGLTKATVHCVVAILTLLAHALASVLLGSPDDIRCAV